MRKWCNLDTITTSEILIPAMVQVFFKITTFLLKHRLNGVMFSAVVEYSRILRSVLRQLWCLKILYLTASFFHYSCVSFGPPEVRFRRVFVWECIEPSTLFTTSPHPNTMNHPSARSNHSVNRAADGLWLPVYVRINYLLGGFKAESSSPHLDPRDDKKHVGFLCGKPTVQ